MGFAAVATRRGWMGVLIARTAGLALASTVPGVVGAGTRRDPGNLFAKQTDAALRPGMVLQFPRDHGAHPAFRTEWWYATGVLRTASGVELGFQVTFFRSRVATRERVQQVQGQTELGQKPGRFEPQHLLFAHGALTDLAAQRHVHAQRLGRWNGEPSARPDHATLADTGVQLGRWLLQRQGGVGAQATYRVLLPQDAQQAWGLDLTLTTTQPVLLQGDAGFSQKGPEVGQASAYYSQPQLQVQGTVQRGGGAEAVRGVAWLDHEWSEHLLHPQAQGWDWVGMNLDDGAALTVFQLRRSDGSAVWAGGSWRAEGHAQTKNFAATDVRWVPFSWWVSPQSGARYPVCWRLETPVGQFEVRASLNAQEMDSRTSTGTVYWEGLSTLMDARSGQRLGQGYLEMTGYAGRVNL